MKRNELLTAVNFYNPQPQVASARAAFEKAAKLAPDLRLLELNAVANNVQGILNTAAQNENDRNEKNKAPGWVETTGNSTGFTTFASCVGTGIWIGSSGGPGGMIFGGVVGAFAGALGGFITSVVTEISLDGTKTYRGMSKDMKAAFKTGRKDAYKLQKEIEKAFEKTYGELTFDMCDASARKEELYTTFPRLKPEMDMARIKAAKAFKAAANPAPEPAPAPKRMEAPTVRIVQQTP